jgi:hypothetical protein
MLSPRGLLKISCKDLIVVATARLYKLAGSAAPGDTYSDYGFTYSIQGGAI